MFYKTATEFNILNTKIEKLSFLDTDW